MDNVFFARINENNFVEEVIVLDSSSVKNKTFPESEKHGSEFIQELLVDDPERKNGWIQTSEKDEFRGRYASRGYFYDSEIDEFIPPDWEKKQGGWIEPKPFPSWVYEEDTNSWIPPVEKPTDDVYLWDEENISWYKLGEFYDEMS